MPRPVITSQQRKRRNDMIQSKPSSNISANSPTSDGFVRQTKRIRNGEQALEEVNLVSQTELHPVVGDGCFYTALGSHCAKFCPELALVTRSEERRVGKECRS